MSVKTRLSLHQVQFQQQHAAPDHGLLGRGAGTRPGFSPQVYVDHRWLGVGADEHITG